MQNWFETLNAALESEKLVEYWPVGLNIQYDETIQFAAKGRWISVYRCSSGRYERPVHYETKMTDTYFFG